MPRKKHPEQYAVKGRKYCWHLYSLQQLPEQRFVEVVNKVLAKKHTLRKTK